MENNTIKCPFCFKESQRGVHVCTGCLATVLYGTFPGWYAFVVLFPDFWFVSGDRNVYRHGGGYYQPSVNCYCWICSGQSDFL